VVAGDPAARTMLVSHRAIGRYMPAMMMPFRVSDADELVGVHPGSRVQFELVVERDRSVARGVKVTGEESAPAAKGRIEIGQPLPDFRLTDQDGRTVTMADLRGKVAAINFTINGVQLPLGLALITLTLLAIAVINLFTKPIATVAGGVFSVILYIVFTVSERRAKNRGVAHVEMDQFNLELEGELSPEAVGARPGNILVPVSNHFNLYHLGNVLDRIKPGRRDVVVLHVRLLRRSASGENELDADQLFGSIEQHLFSQALSMAEKRGKSIRLAVVAANDLWDGILRASTSLQSSTIVIGRSAKDNTEEQAREIGEAWEKLPDPKPQFNLEIHLPNGDKIYKVLGPHAPNLTANEVNLLHRLWLRFSENLAREELHHHDVVHFALEEVQKEIDEGHEDQVVTRLRNHLESNQSKRKPKV